MLFVGLRSEQQGLVDAPYGLYLDLCHVYSKTTILW